MVHKVACLDWMFTQNGYHPLEFLTVSDRIYKLMASDSGKCNRRTRAYYQNAMAALGYDATCHITRTIGHRGPEFPPNTTAVIAGIHYTEKTLDAIRKIRPRLLPRYRQLPDEELMVEDMFLVATKPLVEPRREQMAMVDRQEARAEMFTKRRLRIAENDRWCLLAYYFPPANESGAQRPYRFFKYLPEHGHRVYSDHCYIAGRDGRERDHCGARPEPGGVEQLCRVAGPQNLSL